MILRHLVFGCALIGASLPSAFAWDYDGHRLVNELALAGLPDGFPSFARTPEAAARIAFLAGEPDRWRNTSDLSLKHGNGPDHYLDIEDLEKAGLAVADLSEFRYRFTAEFAAARAARPAKFPPIDPAKNQDQTRELAGYLPWSIIENYAKLRSAFSYLQAYLEAGTPEEIANAQANAIYYMGLLGHYVGDCAQPLHTTKHVNGWVGANPHGYTTSNRFHAWIDGGLLAKEKLTLADLGPRARPAQLLGVRAPGTTKPRDPVFEDVLGYVLAQHRQLEPLYQLDKTGALKPDAPNGGPGRAFLEEQLLRGGGMLGSLWLTAWRRAGPDVYLQAQLLKRKADAP